ncbi:helix-turn-helix domain-containing protein [Niallia circulans]|uniref:helix-turn-helix domain-containing protein n=1 Tax=Niallia circulans TaxID=1397 RepID=UPI0015609400|nr:helix-turn-helix domain-containing protein [Niallia circulans]NRG30677.1 helix-turn-helix domain-containing protein [Niallia circulans]
MHYLAEHSTFDSTAQLNAAVYEHIRNHTYELNETDRKALKMIARYCVKFAGACHLKASTISELIDRSEKTARRIVNKLAELGIIEKVATTRKVNGGKGANIIRILPANVQSSVSNRASSDKPTESKVEASNSENEPSNSIKPLKSNYVLDTAVEPNALKNVLPSGIYNAIVKYFHNAESIYKYYGILLRAKASVDPTVVIEDNEAPFIEAWNATILKAKQRKVKRMDDYLFASWKQATLTVKRLRNKANSMAGRFAEWFDE